MILVTQVSIFIYSFRPSLQSLSKGHSAYCLFGAFRPFSSCCKASGQVSIRIDLCNPSETIVYSSKITILFSTICIYAVKHAVPCLLLKLFGHGSFQTCQNVFFRCLRCTHAFGGMALQDLDLVQWLPRFTHCWEGLSDGLRSNLRSSPSTISTAIGRRYIIGQSRLRALI